MSKFHINNDGDPGPCGASKGKCPFGSPDEHYDSVEEARAAYEVQMASSELFADSEKVNTRWVKTKPCMVCSQPSMIEVNSEGLQKYQAGAFVQDAFPELDAEQRELFVSGTHAHCWRATFGDPEDEEDF